VCISTKAESETLAISPRAKTVVIPNGFDDAASWPHKGTSPIPGQITTFGHHNNKRPELMIKALPLIRAQIEASLTVLGAKDEYQKELRQLAFECGVSQHVDFPGFVSHDHYQRIISSSSLIALTSSDEGFGLPVAEAACLGIPALITSDSGMADIFGDYPTVASPDVTSIGEAAVLALLSGTSRGTADGSTLPQTWRESVIALRREAVKISGSREVV
jgi:glycosyltransferase involved in cell wall biosynthesis